MRIAILLIAACALSACGGGDEPAKAPPVFAVTYKVEGLGLGNVTANATYSAGPGITRQDKVKTPATLPAIFGAPQPIFAQAGEFLYISAQNDSSSGGVSVSILVDGKSIGTASSSAPFGIATVSKACC